MLITRQLNLLPPGRRLGLRQEILLSAITRFLHDVVVGLIILAVLASLAAVGMWVGSLLVGQTAESELAQQVASYHEIKGRIESQNALMEFVDNQIKGRLVWSNLVPSLLATVPPDVTIDTLRVDMDTATVSFSGTARARSSLVVFEQRLRLLPWVVDMTAPRTNLLERVNAAYTFSLTIEAAGTSSSQDYGDTQFEP